MFFSPLEGHNSIGASSDKCDNFKNVRIVDALWYENVLRGVSLLPKVLLSVNEWTAFTMKSPHLNPLFCSKVHAIDGTNDTDVVYILLETGIYPDIHAITSGSTIVAVNWWHAYYTMTDLFDSVMLYVCIQTGGTFRHTVGVENRHMLGHRIAIECITICRIRATDFYAK